MGDAIRSRRDRRTLAHRVIVLRPGYGLPGETGGCNQADNLLGREQRQVKGVRPETERLSSETLRPFDKCRRCFPDAS